MKLQRRRHGLDVLGLRHALACLAADEQRISEIIEQNSELTEAEIGAFFGAHNGCRPRQAVLGFAHTIKVEIPRVSVILNLAFKD
jgi:hypothetical protein